jgi:glycosyltransferase involved in cell wall biosynthesis
MFSLVIPVYKNEAHLEQLLEQIAQLNVQLEGRLETVLVVDASPDNSYSVLQKTLPIQPFRSQLLLLSRNFGAFRAISAGLAAAKGDFLAVIAADLQEPPEMILDFFKILKNDEADVVFGTRVSRADPLLSRWTSEIFWHIYRRFILRDMPHGGIDVFGCNRRVRDELIAFRESNTNLIALLFWVGFRRAFVPYSRAARASGKSSWTFRKKARYLLDSIFNFTDLPIQILLFSGMGGLGLAFVWGMVVFVSKILGHIPVPGYTALVLAVLFFGGLTTFGLGVVGEYLWLTLQNARRRPNYIVAKSESYPMRAAE